MWWDQSTCRQRATLLVRCFRSVVVLWRCFLGNRYCSWSRPVCVCVVVCVQANWIKLSNYIVDRMIDMHEKQTVDSTTLRPTADLSVGERGHFVHGLLSLCTVGSACAQWKIGDIIFLVLIFFYSNVSLFPLYPVQYKFIANFSYGSNTNSHNAFWHLHCILP